MGGGECVSNLTNMKAQLENLKSLYNTEKGVLNQLKSTQKEKEEQILTLQQEKYSIEMKRLILQEASDEARMQAKETLQSVATHALQYIMGEHTSLEIDLDVKGNSPTASFYVVKTYQDYVVRTDPAEEDGGGYADIVAFSLFVAMLQLAGKDNIAPLFLDEPSKYVSAGHSEKVANFLYDVCKSISRQAFMVTHDVFIANIGDTAYHFHINEEGKSIVKKVA